MKTLTQALEEKLARENRRIVSVWRAHVLLAKATSELAEFERRWRTVNMESVRRFLSQHSDRFEPLEGHEIFRVKAPYASSLPADEEEILMEAHPFCALSHFTALVFHDLTDDLPNEIHATTPVTLRNAPLPPGTERNDWRSIGLRHVHARMLTQIRGTPVQWHQTRYPFVGMELFRPRQYPIRYSNVERTLLDALQHPNWSGGLGKVLRAWRRARDALNVPKLVSYAEAIGVGILKQRAGFLIERMGLGHPTLDEWARNAERGGSSRLDAASAFISDHSDRWKISINTSLAPLDDDQ